MYLFEGNYVTSVLKRTWKVYFSLIFLPIGAGVCMQCIQADICKKNHFNYMKPKKPACHRFLFGAVDTSLLVCVLIKADRVISPLWSTSNTSINTHVPFNNLTLFEFYKSHFKVTLLQPHHKALF